MRNFGPGMSARIATCLPTCSAATRMAAAVWAWCSGVPWAKLSRATSTPAAISLSSTSGSLEAGPIVATIFVERICDGLYPSRQPGRGAPASTGALLKSPLLAGEPAEPRLDS